MTMQMKQLASSPSRSGRHLQRYNQGFRQVVGCIPYRIRKTKKSASTVNETLKVEDLEVLLISSQKSSKMMFPKGGWELDEDIELAALRETLEEAGVIGAVGKKLGEWVFKSKSQDKFHEGSMFSMLVTEELDVWPEKDSRQRVWMTVDEARQVCVHSWMKEALDVFICQFSHQRILEEGEEEAAAALALALGSSCRLELCRREELRVSIGGQSLDEDVDCYLFS